jgi:hypothetical protein
MPRESSCKLIPGLHLLAPRGEVPTGALYYPWMHDRSDVHVIELSEDEKRNNIDLK